MKASNFGFGTAIFSFGLIAVGMVGWVLNIIKLCGMDAEPLTTMFIMRIIGIFVAPIGSILGLFV